MGVFRHQPLNRMILVIDNYDSFVHNLARYLRRLGCETKVLRNDEVTVELITEMAPQAIVLSPGPCTPTQAGCCLDVVAKLGPTIPILGICLGHQAIVQALGGSIVRANEPIHGRQSPVLHGGSRMFANIPSPFAAGRYHSLIASKTELPENLVATAHTDDGTIMAVEHSRWPTVGLQFHPESILTDCGYQLLVNFLKVAMVENLQLPDELPTSDWQSANTVLSLSDRLSIQDAS
ncbi:MAG: aminodeoxychorismate/anthranilate synthase component II [Mariniblastus sp.]